MTGQNPVFIPGPTNIPDRLRHAMSIQTMDHRSLDSEELIDHLRDTYAVSFGVGLGPLARKVFRIGHLGAMTDVMALSGIGSVKMAMADLGYPVEPGSGTRAAPGILPSDGAARAASRRLRAGFREGCPRSCKFRRTTTSCRRGGSRGRRWRPK